jgi:Arc/MetJ family transcription regulator
MAKSYIRLCQPLEVSNMGRTTMVIDEELLEEARRLSGARTNREAVERALREMLVRLRRREMVSHAGTVEIGITQADLRAMREDR